MNFSIDFLKIEIEHSSPNGWVESDLDELLSHIVKSHGFRITQINNTSFIFDIHIYMLDEKENEVFPFFHLMGSGYLNITKEDLETYFKIYKRNLNIDKFLNI